MKAGVIRKQPMTIDNLPDLKPPDFGNIIDPGRPILSFAWHMDGPHRASAHSHPRAHIIHPESGAYWVVTPEGTWLVPPGQAIWIPPHVHHEVYAQGSISARMIFVDPAFAGPLPAHCGTVMVSPLLDELLRRTSEYGNDYPPDGPAARLAMVMLDELARMELAPLLIPVSNEPRLAHAMAVLINAPDVRTTIDGLASEAGASPRTLARLFQHETGMTFTQWRTRLLLVESIERLARGASITQVAFDLGYSTTSSFVYMFRSNLGTAPGHYRRRAVTA
jgi:AraC-like DNA-binding protein/mannose-6-phosphate isomerase-like protein (cupin superfamily)